MKDFIPPVALTAVIRNTCIASASNITYTATMRACFFSQAEGNIFIDFIPYRVQPGYLYLIPPMHCCYTTDAVISTTDFVEINMELLSPKNKMRLYTVVYGVEKTLPLNNANCPATTLQKAFTDGVTPQDWIFNCIEVPGSLQQAEKMPWLYMQYVENFLAELPSITETCTVNKIATKLCIHERTLRRACIDVLGLSPRDILQYHMLLKAKYLLADVSLNVQHIADLLGFSNSSSFTRYIKNMLHVSPVAFRQQIAGQFPYSKNLSV
jgi:AraC-like DNA-binding protein